MTTLADVARIAAIPDPLVRNCEITWAYHDIGVAFAARNGAFINWCLVAAWASKQAGNSIRGEDLRNTLRRRLAVSLSWRSPVDSAWRWLLRRGLLSPGTRLGRIVRAVPGPLDAFERASAAVADGNLKVFVEIAPAFLRALANVDLELRDGDPPDGQRLLKQAFGHYDQARSEPDPRRRAQLNYLGNVEVAWHEQTRLQEQITASVDAPALTARELGRRIAPVLLPMAAGWAPVIFVLGAAAKPFAAFGRRLARRIITERMMYLGLPAGRIVALGENLLPNYPESLRQIDHPELLSALAAVEAGDGDCGADDWTSLRDRMRFIARLQRVIFEDEALAEPVFTREQLAEIRGGALPAAGGL